MAYALSFADEFFWGDDSVPRDELKPRPRPTSVYQAALSLTDEVWAALARDVFHCPPDNLDPESAIPGNNLERLRKIPVTGKAKLPKCLCLRFQLRPFQIISWSTCVFAEETKRIKKLAGGTPSVDQLII